MSQTQLQLDGTVEGFDPIPEEYSDSFSRIMEDGRLKFKAIQDYIKDRNYSRRDLEEDVEIPVRVDQGILNGEKLEEFYEDWQRGEIDWPVHAAGITVYDSPLQHTLDKEPLPEFDIYDLVIFYRIEDGGNSPENWNFSAIPELYNKPEDNAHHEATDYDRKSELEHLLFELRDNQVTDVRLREPREEQLAKPESRW